MQALGCGCDTVPQRIACWYKAEVGCTLLLLVLLLVPRVLCMLPCQPRSVRKALPAEGAMLAAANNCVKTLP